MATRVQDVEALVVRARDQLQKIEAEYSKSLEQQKISTSLKLDIKSFFENLKSVLDYLAVEVAEKFCGVTGGKTYFPITPNKPSFDGTIKKDFPGLEKASPTVLAIIENV